MKAKIEVSINSNVPLLLSEKGRETVDELVKLVTKTIALDIGAEVPDLESATHKPIVFAFKFLGLNFEARMTPMENIGGVTREIVEAALRKFFKVEEKKYDETTILEIEENRNTYDDTVMAHSLSMMAKEELLRELKESGTEFHRNQIRELIKPRIIESELEKKKKKYTKKDMLSFGKFLLLKQSRLNYAPLIDIFEDWKEKKNEN